MLADKLAFVQKNIEEACKNADRSAEEVTLIAVSKTKPVEMLRKHMTPVPVYLVKTRYRRLQTNMIRCHLT